MNAFENTQINTNTREAYLKERAEWRENYRNLSEEIRQAKHKIKEAQRQYATGGSIVEVARSLIAYERLRGNATELLEARKQSKIQAAQNYLAARGV